MTDYEHYSPRLCRQDFLVGDRIRVRNDLPVADSQGNAYADQGDGTWLATITQPLKGAVDGFFEIGAVNCGICSKYGQPHGHTVEELIANVLVTYAGAAEWTGDAAPEPYVAKIMQIVHAETT